VPHDYCEEHGTLEHAEPCAPAPSKGEDGAEGASGAQFAASTHGSDDHVQCGIVGKVPPRSTVPTPVLKVRPALASTSPARLHPAPPRGDELRFRLAPKQSPPSVVCL
jgi:hypothetical protein